MNIEKIARKALTIIKLKYGLPTGGLLAGGAIANIMWQIVSGERAAINDIDIFLHTTESDKETLLQYTKLETSYFDTYRQMGVSTSVKDSYMIKESSNVGMFNFIKYQSNNDSPQLIIDSFDINSTQIGYSINENKFYYTKDFIEFLKTGNLKIVSLTTPAHTAIRIIKKQVELNAKLDMLEILLCNYALRHKQRFLDIYRVRFMQRYADMYSYLLNTKCGYMLKDLFNLRRDLELEESLKKSNSKVEKIYIMEPIGDSGLPNIITRNSSDFLFYIRNIYRNKNLEDVWQSLSCVYTFSEYMDKPDAIEDIQFLSKILTSYPSCVENLKGLKFSDQVNICRGVLEKVTEQFDYTTAINVLTNQKFNTYKYVESKIDDDTALLLGLAVRKLNIPVDIADYF